VPTPTGAATPAWLSEAILYQIYPQSFADSDGDGVGDFPGVLKHLDYLAWLGVDVVWFSPCFASPFADAGYDVSDYLTVAPRYGTNDDLQRVIDGAAERGIRVMLDLVPGHTSHRHPWFTASAGDPDDHRYIWSDRVGTPVSRWIPSPGTREGYYLANFYPVQPALNFGYARTNPAEPWRQPVDAPGPRANRAALREIMAYWFDRGVAGFRVDMAFSLVKDDPGGVETGRLWREVREWVDREYPDRALISEWGDPGVSVPAGFHADFFLHFVGDALRSLWGNAQGSHSRQWDDNPCFFAPEGEGSMRPFLDAWRSAVDTIDGAGRIALPTANHDFSRLACGTRTREMTAPVFAFLLTWPTLPTIYFGDEIGMRYVPGTPDTEGADLGDGQRRQGSRTPMQWDGTEGAGFSTAKPDHFYLPLDPDPGRPNVADSMADPDSLLHQVRRLIALRKARPSLGSAATTELLHEDYPLAYRRGGDHVVVINPRREPGRLTLPGAAGLRPLEVRGITVNGDEIVADGFSYGVFTR
jgi:maltose alpha-D-glucosyltransferase/alpha-amylase